MKYIEINAPAKINIGLNIVSKRNDGFHNLETFFYPILDLHDKLIFEKSEIFLFECDDDSIPSDESNLVVKTVKILEKAANRKINVRIKLFKKIPSGAGLGGGSSDAGAALISLNEMFNLNFTQDDLTIFALELGSDVPFFLKSKPAVGKSRGEKLTISELNIQNPILIINPGIHISTQEAFQNIIPTVARFDYNYFIEKTSIDFKKLREELTNDFEKYIFTKYAEIRLVKKALLDAGAQLAMMSGTGSTVFGIFKNLKEAEIAFQKFPDSYFKFISFDQN